MGREFDGRGVATLEALMRLLDESIARDGERLVHLGRTFPQRGGAFGMRHRFERRLNKARGIELGMERPRFFPERFWN
jgi:hypothetical protein